MGLVNIADKRGSLFLYRTTRLRRGHGEVKLGVSITVEVQIEY